MRKSRRSGRNKNERERTAKNTSEQGVVVNEFLARKWAEKGEQEEDGDRKEAKQQ